MLCCTIVLQRGCHDNGTMWGPMEATSRPLLRLKPEPHLVHASKGSFKDVSQTDVFSISALQSHCANFSVVAWHLQQRACTGSSLAGDNIIVFESRKSRIAALACLIRFITAGSHSLMRWLILMEADTASCPGQSLSLQLCHHLFIHFWTWHRVEPGSCHSPVVRLGLTVAAVFSQCPLSFCDPLRRYVEENASLMHMLRL